MKDEKIDFSPLDPSLRKDAWERRISDIVAVATNGRQPAASLWVQLAAWARPPLIAAGVAAAFCLAIAAFTITRGTASRFSVQQEPALALSGWVAGADLPSTDKILHILGGTYDEK